MGYFSMQLRVGRALLVLFYFPPLHGPTDQAKVLELNSGFKECSKPLGSGERNQMALFQLFPAWQVAYELEVGEMFNFCV